MSEIDIAPSFNFKEAFAEAEARSLAGDEPELNTTATDIESGPAPEGEPRPDATGRLHGSDGRFVPKSQSEPEPEPAPEGEPAPAPEAPSQPQQEPELILGKFRNVEDLARSYQELETHLGSQRQELGDLRRTVDDWRTQQAQQAQIPTGDPWAMIDDDPAAATKLAAAQGNWEAYQAAAQAWDDLSPGMPQYWAETEQFKYEMEQQLGQIAQAVSHGYMQTRDQEWKSRYEGIQRDLPNLDALRPKMLDVARRLSWLIEDPLRNGNPEQQEQILRLVADLALRDQGENLTQAAREIAREQAAEADRAREEAFVATQANVSQTESAPPTETEQWIARIKAKAEMWDNGLEFGS